MLVTFKVCQLEICFLSVYVPQCCLSDAVRDIFYDLLCVMTAMIPALEFLITFGEAVGITSQTLILR